MKRRDLIKTIAIVTTNTFIVPSITFGPESDLFLKSFKRNDEKLKGFIVSDAHFGWNNIEQPSPETQKLMMQRIIRRFPDLDVFIDTGDAHHGALKREPGDIARGNWTDIIAGGCDKLPFFYVAGNHEIIGTLYDGDQESRCIAMGSVSCRPYYSFDIKGIHFISLPELVEPVYINNESLEWLALDLEINTDKTVILLSHNNIKGTTTLMGEPGYRGLVNSHELIRIFKKYPNIISWMHGHNHTFEVLENEKMLFVSNGRIGGFIPPASWGKTGQGHLGGIYFEITSDYMLVRSYSASEEKFFDEIGENHLSGLLESKTSFDSNSKSSYSYGVGGMINGQMIPVYNHHISDEMESDLFIKKEANPFINDDPDFSLFEFRSVEKTGYQWLLMGSSVGTPKYFEKENKLWEWTNPGIRLLHQENPDTFIDVNTPDWRFSKYCYYRGVPGKRYKIFIHLNAQTGGQKLRTELTCYDNLGNELVSLSGDEHILEQGFNEIDEVFKVPGLSDSQIIYNDTAIDSMIQISVKARFSGMRDDIILKRFALSEDVGTSYLEKSEIALDGITFSVANGIKVGEISHFVLKTPTQSRIVVQTRSGNCQRMTWLLRQKLIKWQVRNATATHYGDCFEVEALRNTWTFRKEVIIVPLFRNDKPFIHRLQNIQKSRIYPIKGNNKSLQIHIMECNESGTVIIYSETKPKKISGSEGWYFDNKLIIIKARGKSQINITI